MVEYNDIFISSVAMLKPLKIYPDLNSHKEFKEDLYKVGGVYGFINISPILPASGVGKQYIGSSFNLYGRFLDHLTLFLFIKINK